VNEEIPLRLREVASGGRLAIAIVDADHFKRINDTLSHEVGDQAICELSRVLQAALPAGPDPATASSRLVARLGGEEYLLVLPGLEMAEAARVLRAVRDAVAGHDWRPLLGTLSLTVSVGGAAAQPQDTQSTLLARADQNLYMAKAAGRNRVVVDGPTPGRHRAVRGLRSATQPAALVSRTRAALAAVGAAESEPSVPPERATANGRGTSRGTDRRTAS
jgi:two-component system cell cycle response regulator